MQDAYRKSKQLKERDAQKSAMKNQYWAEWQSGMHHDHHKRQKQQLTSNKPLHNHPADISSLTVERSARSLNSLIQAASTSAALYPNHETGAGLLLSKTSSAEVTDLESDGGRGRRFRWTLDGGTQTDAYCGDTDSEGSNSTLMEDTEVEGEQGTTTHGRHYVPVDYQSEVTDTEPGSYTGTSFLFNNSQLTRRIETALRAKGLTFAEQGDVDTRQGLLSTQANAHHTQLNSPRASKGKANGKGRQLSRSRQ